MAEITKKTGLIEDDFQIIKSILEDENNIDAEFELVLKVKLIFAAVVGSSMVVIVA